MRSKPPEGTPIEFVSTTDMFAFEGDYVIGRAESILPTEDYLIVGDQLGDPRVIVYDLDQRKPIQRLGRSGAGPGEVGYPTSLHMVYGVDDSIQLADLSRRRITIYSVNPNGLEFERHVPWPVDVLALDALPLKRGYGLTGFLADAAVYVVEDLSEDPVDATARSFRKLGRPPPPYTGGGIMIGSPSYTNSDPSGERVAVGYLSSTALQFLSADGSSSVFVTDTVELRVPMARPDQPVSLIVDVVTTDDRVFALFCGCHRNDESPNEILVYDWAGKLRGVMVLDHGVYSIGVARDGRRVFGGIEEPEPIIGVWEVPDGW